MNIIELTDFNLGVQKGKYLQSLGFSYEEAIDGVISLVVKEGIRAAYFPQEAADSLSDCVIQTLGDLKRLEDTVKLLNSKVDNVVLAGSSTFRSFINDRAKHLGYRLTRNGLLRLSDRVLVSVKDEDVFRTLNIPFINHTERINMCDSWFQTIQDDTLPFFTAAIHYPKYSLDLIIQGRAKDKDDFLKIQSTIPHTETSRNEVYYLSNIQPQEVNDWGTEPDMRKVSEWIESYKAKGYQL